MLQATSHPATAHPAYLYPTTLVSLGSGVNPASNESQEYHDPAIVETGSEGLRALLAPPYSMQPVLPMRALPPLPKPSFLEPAHRYRPRVAQGSWRQDNGVIQRHPKPFSPLRTIPRVVNGISLMVRPNLPSRASTQARGQPGATVCLAPLPHPAAPAPSVPERSSFPPCSFSSAP